MKTTEEQSNGAAVALRPMVSPLHLTLRLKKLEEIEVEQARNIREEWREVGSQMRRRREAAGLSLRQLAKRLKLSAPFVSDMERGHRRYSLRYVTEALAIFGANAGGVPRPENAPTPKQSTPEKL